MKAPSGHHLTCPPILRITLPILTMLTSLSSICLSFWCSESSWVFVFMASSMTRSVGHRVKGLCKQARVMKKHTGCPKKRGISVWQAVEGIRSGLNTKVGWVLKNSGNFLSNEHKNSPLLWKNRWEKWGQICLPPLKKWHYMTLWVPYRFLLCP